MRRSIAGISFANIPIYTAISINRQSLIGVKGKMRHNMIQHRWWVSGLVCVFWLTSVLQPAIHLKAAEFDPAKLAALHEKMQKYVDQHVVAGSVAVIGSKDGIAAIDAVGFQNIESAKPLAKDALFRIASMTKPITAMGIMILQEEGKLSIDDPVERHLPEFKGQKLVASRGEGLETLKKTPRPITIRDLLTHTSGLPGGFPPGLADLYFKRNLTLQEAVLVSSQQPLDFEPGSKWSYCNAGIDTLGRIIEVSAGEAYETFLKRRIFDPLGMKDTAFYPDAEQLQRLAGLYDSKDGQLKLVEYSLLGPVKDAKHPIPAGGLYSTGADLAKLYQLMLHRGTIGSTKILSEQSVATMTKVQTGDLVCGFTPGMSFGFGWAVVNKPQGVHEMMSAGTYGHGGAFGTQGWIDPQQDVFVILLIQRVGLPNADGSDIRKDLQTVAVGALKK
jgi:CubicO group peptidase (beta-lactamase class C family)